MRIAKAVEARRRELRKRYSEVANAASISVSELWKIRTCKHRARVSTLQQLSVGLEWPPDYLEEVRSGKPHLRPVDVSVAEQALERILAEVAGLSSGFDAVLQHLKRIEEKIDRHDLP